MSAKRGYQDRRLVVWGLITLAGAVVMFATLRLDGLLGIIGTASATLLLVIGGIGVLWRVGQLQHQVSPADLEEAHKRESGA